MMRRMFTVAPSRAGRAVPVLQRRCITETGFKTAVSSELAKIAPHFDAGVRAKAVEKWIAFNFDDSYMKVGVEDIAEHVHGFLISEVQAQSPKVKAIRDAFEAHDKNKSGTIDIHELPGLLRSLNVSADKPQVKALMDKYGRQKKGLALEDVMTIVKEDSVYYRREREMDATYICNYHNRGDILQKIENYVVSKQHLMHDHAVSLRSYNSTFEDMTSESVMLFTVKFNKFTDPTGKGHSVEELSTKEFLSLRTESSKQRYDKLLKMASEKIKPAFVVTELRPGVHVLHVAFSPDRPTYLTAINNLVSRIPHAVIQKQFFETFSNGRQVYTMYVKGATSAALESVASSLFMLPSRPNDPIMRLYNDGELSSNEAIFGFAGTMFAYYFTPPAVDDDIVELRRALRKDELSMGRLHKVHSGLFQQVMRETFVGEVIREDLQLFRKIFTVFDEHTQGKAGTTAAAKALREYIDATYHADRTRAALWHSFVTFAVSVKATNFFKSDRAAVSFRLDPSFVAGLNVPRVPYAIYMVLGSTFRGFHIRFHDIARGGIRMILPRSRNDYTTKKNNLFHENYGLAYTQMLKNKDIPESGSKGTILVSPRYDAKAWSKKTLFLQYVSALLDIMTMKEGVRSTLEKPEILFLGPDENTAGDFPSTAAKFAKYKGYPQWKSLTTGKDPADGGIPHDTYGMTTTSVRAFVEGIYHKFGLDQTKLTKFQTGGPDGDLGSNEILMGKEKWTGICDKSGCLFDPRGLVYAELEMLAKERLTCSSYNKNLLSKDGAFVPIDAKNVKLPDGTVVDGEQFMTEFHFSKHVRADTFVPCGGRPNSVTLNNVHKLIDVKGITGEQLLEGSVSVPQSALHFKYIVEGANLFISPDARIALENAGVILFKDASANKGGVTSSSIEVFCGLAMEDAQHAKVMCMRDGHNHEVYDKIAAEIVAKVRKNAEKEFNAIWNDAAAGRCGGHRSVICDVMSRKMVEIFEFVSKSNLMEDKALFKHVLKEYCPPTLLEQVPMDTLLARVPPAYTKAIFEKALASDYVYTYGVAANEFSFYQYMSKLTAAAHASHPKDAVTVAPPRGVAPA